MDFKKVFTASFALFGIIFGSGNIIYPSLLGSELTENVLCAILGFGLAAAVLPVIGIVSKIMHKGSAEEYFEAIGKKQAAALISIIIFFLGPIGICPRCTLVSHSAMNVVFNTPIYLFSTGFAILSMLLLMRKNYLDDMAKYFAPVMIIGIILIALISIYNYKGFVVWGDVNFPDFKDSFFKGFQTLDLIGTPLFAAGITNYVKGDKSNIIGMAILSSLILAIAYTCFILLGAMYYESVDVSTEVLFDIVDEAAPEYKIIASVLTLLACLTSFIALIDVASAHISKIFKIEKTLSIIINLVISTFVSFLDFSILQGILILVGHLVYPSMSCFAIASIFTMNKNIKRVSFYLPLLITIVRFCI